MLAAAKKMLEIPRISDKLQILARGRFPVGVFTPRPYTIVSTGTAPSVEQIMERFGVDKEYAEAFLRRNA